MIDLKLDRVSKKYKIRQGDNSPKRWYNSAFRQRSAEVWALRDVSFEVKEGEALGIVGHNGAGKTTILKILSSITSPTEGEITIRGRLAALIEISSGFHPELTGRENIYLHGSMLGMRRAEIARKMDSIVEFSGVQKYIDVPLKRYSSGMHVRLGFSVAAHLDPDIVLLDEVLAVGDVAFQAKCLDRIAELRKSGRTIVFVSHDLASVYRICDRALLLDRGQVLMDGPPRNVIDHYQKMAFADQGTSLTESDPAKPAECVSISFHGSDSGPIRTGYPMIARLGYRASECIQDAVVRISFYWPSGYLCAQLTNESSGPSLTLEPGEGMIEFDCPVLPIVPGLYRVDIGIERNGTDIDLKPRCAALPVDAGRPAAGDFYIENRWRLQDERLPVS
ncbi:MAG TPA: polysaccharide ABC transporter ATP-binding protein [Candidatus Sulfotelmatobacter sp.]|nr:polysaccharide ABC transporter ATP-binding protein [Candidatus Sulfotelmatobacter sp.]